MILSFFDLRMVYVIPYNVCDTKCHGLCVFFYITGSCHAGGMNCAEALLHSFRILEPDCGPGVGVSKGFGAFIIWPIFRFSNHHLCYRVKVKGERKRSIMVTCS
ncbi:hypothetical protein HanPSC8_Chr06g0265851 [Helianthus annuus]|nr:hypothetical protein HanPSC8_Chr06g0265851 [Helianthus annuus]